MGEEVRTIKDLYDWAAANNALDLPFGLQFQDSDGCYQGNSYRYGETVHASLDKEDGDNFVLLS